MPFTERARKQTWIFSLRQKVESLGASMAFGYLVLTAVKTLMLVNYL